MRFSTISNWFHVVSVPTPHPLPENPLYPNCLSAPCSAHPLLTRKGPFWRLVHRFPCLGLLAIPWLCFFISHICQRSFYISCIFLFFLIFLYIYLIYLYRYIAYMSHLFFIFLIFAVFLSYMSIINVSLIFHLFLFLYFYLICLLYLFFTFVLIFSLLSVYRYKSPCHT